MRYIPPPGSPESLRNAARLVRRGWTRFALARNSHGKGTSVGDPDAVSWCAVGALFASETPGSTMAANMELVEAYLSIPGHRCCLVEWNNHLARDGEQVARAFERVADIIRAVRKGTPVPEKAPEVLPESWKVEVVV